MMHLNLLFFPTLVLAIGLFAAFSSVAGRITPRRLMVYSAFALAAAIPALLFVVYYLHLLDRSAWFYQFRALPCTELTASGLGLGAGLAAGILRRVALRRKSAVLHWFLPSVILFCLLLLLLVPYAKPLIAPLHIELLDQWRDGVCIQTTPSTCGPSSAATILRRFGCAASERELARECFSYGGGTENWYLARALRRRGLDVRYLLLSAQPAAIPFPSIAGTEIGGRGGTGHFIAIMGQQDGRYIVGDPIAGRLFLTPEALRARFYLTGFFMAVRDRQHTSLKTSGDKTEAWEQTYHLHGAIHIHHYKSRALGMMRRLHVYTPPGYDPKSRRPYPVLYLLHGSPGDDANWTAYGNLAPTLDTMMLNGQCLPYLVVMPDSEVPRRRYGSKGFERNLLQDILPFIENSYRVRKDAEGRALAGFSMGGFQSIAIGLNHLDTFAWIGVFSAGLREGFTTEADLTQLKANPKTTRKHLKLLYVRIGKRDFFLRDARKFHALLKEKAIPHVYQEVNGAHEWPVWQGALADFAPRLFTAKSNASVSDCIKPPVFLSPFVFCYLSAPRGNAVVLRRQCSVHPALLRRLYPLS